MASLVGKSDIVKGKVEDKYAADEKRWRAESDMRTLADAEKIRSDKSRRNEAKKMAKMKMEEMKKVCC